MGVEEYNTPIGEDAVTIQCASVPEMKRADDANIVTACRRCIPTAILLLLLSTSGGVEAESHPLFAVGREHVRLRTTIRTCGPVAFARCCAGISKRKLARYRGGHGHFMKAQVCLMSLATASVEMIQMMLLSLAMMNATCQLGKRA